MLKRADRDFQPRRIAEPLGVISFRKWSDIYSSWAIHKEQLNAATDEYGDLVSQGVLDPVKVTKSALVNATSIAGMLLTTETLVVEKPEEEKAPAANGHGHSHPH